MQIDVNNDKCMGLAEYLLYHYKRDVEVLLTRPQGKNVLVRSSVERVHTGVLVLVGVHEADTAACAAGARPVCARHSAAAHQ